MAWIVLSLLGVLYVFAVYKWVEGIDYMHKNHPDYKGDDFFGEPF
jgi:hypothetical protein